MKKKQIQFRLLATAMIDFQKPASVCSGRLYGTLMVSDFYGNNTGGGVVFTDACSGYTVQINYPISTTIMQWSPDIIVGNCSDYPSTDYMVAAAFVNNSGVGEIDYYRVHYTSSSTFTVTASGSTLINSAYQPMTIHLDILGEFGSTSATGLPWCNAFVVTWDDVFGGGNIYAQKATVFPHPTTISSGVMINASGTTGYAPDVAYIQRSGTSGVDEIAMITWTDGATLYYNEWTVGTGVGTPISLLSGSLATIDMPRIDAPDDYSINSPTPFPYPLPGISINKIVAEIGGDVYTFDTYMGGTGNWVSSIVVPPAHGSPHRSPTVAYGPNGGTQYAVSHYSNTSTNDYVYMEPIDWSLPTGLAAAPSTALDYFLVNSSAIASGVGVGFNFQNAISTPCNNPSDRTLVAWAKFNGTTTDYDVYYKLTDYGGTNGYSFRESAPVAITNAVTEKWDIYPNPATTTLIINSPEADARYELIDMLGRNVGNGAITTRLQSIDIGQLGAGTYILNTYTHDVRSYHSVFVKK